MSARILEPMGDAAQWTPSRPDGAPSADLAMVDEQVVVGYGADGRAARITAAPNAVGHVLRRTIAAVDISGYTELRLSIRADRRTEPFFLELRLGSTALPVDDPANTWHRLLPVRKPQTWETVRLSLDDLPPTVANGVTQLRLRCLGAPFTAYLDDITAVLPRMLADADRALESRLAGITVAGAVATAGVRAPGQQVPAAPALDIVHFDLRYAPERATEQRLRRDFTTTGAREVSLGDPYDLDYALTPVAADRTTQAALLEAALDRLRPYDELTVDGERLPAELIWIVGRDRIGGAATEVPVLFYRVGVRRPVVLGTPVLAVRDIRLETEHLETA
ncbi:hypothetical protein [Actinophytocola sp.]|uniref:hypothetical protein n=1 Tax=Actinophytocola sp. TaxID=1872138 RepID=UPI00389AA7BF